MASPLPAPPADAPVTGPGVTGPGETGPGEIEPGTPDSPPELDVEAASGPADPLLACLVFLARYHGRPRSASVLLSGLPAAEGRLPVTLFQRAAARAGLTATVVRRAIARIHPWTLPAVIMLRDGEAAVLVERRADGSARLVMDEGGSGVVEVGRDELEARYAGHAILVKPEFAHGRQQAGVELPEARSWFWGTLAQNAWTYGQVAFASVLLNLFALANPLFTMNVYDRILPNNAAESAIALAAGVGIVLLFDLILRNLRGWFIDFVGRRADVVLTCRIFDHVLDMRLAHRPQSAGAFASMLREFETIREFFTSATLAAFIDLPFAGLFLAVIFVISPELGLILAAAMALVLVWGLLIQIPIARSTRALMAQGENKHGVLVEAINGLETIRMVGAEGRMRALWEGLVGQNAALGQRMRLYSNIGVNFVQFVQQSTSIVIVLAGVFLVGDGLLTAGGLIASVILSGRAIGPMAQTAQLMLRFHQARSSLSSLNRLMETPVERPSGASFVHRPRLAGGIEFRKAAFAYPGADIEVLQDVSFAVSPGERVGIVGRIGSGKTTLAKLLAGLYPPGGGSVLLDGTDIRQIEPSDLRANIGFVPQDLFLFRGTIRENIAIAVPGAEDAEIAAVAEAIGLHDFVTRHPHGYDLQVGERGDGLSGGQRQGVALARALLKRPSILVLDEPTSSMDATTERRVVDALPRFMEERTIVLITHRVSLLALVDRVIVLDQGRVVADGPRETVLDALSSGRVKAGM